MRFTPAAIILATALALTASSSMGKKATEAEPISPAVSQWLEHGSEVEGMGDLMAARAAYETALLLSPGDPDIYFALGKIARAQKMPGRAIKYFDDVRRLDPQNQLAVREEGLAMMDKGAVESARMALAELKELCAKNCAVAEPLAAAIAAGPPKYLAADASPPAKSSPLEN